MPSIKVMIRTFIWKLYSVIQVLGSFMTVTCDKMINAFYKKYRAITKNRIKIKQPLPCFITIQTDLVCKNGNKNI